MSGMIIMDGTGSGQTAKVNGDNRLRVESVSKSEVTDANDSGNAYNLNTGIIALTSGNESSVFYLKNTDATVQIHVSTLIIWTGPSTGGDATTDMIFTIVRNPTGGTIISSPTDVDINSNRNFGSANSLIALAYKGAEGNTFSGHTDHIIVGSTGGRVAFSSEEVLTNGASIGVQINPQTSNTAMNCYVAAVCHTEAV